MSHVHRAYRLAHVMRRAWWWLRRPTNHGVMVALWCGSHVLLVRNSYRSHCWTLPGGFVDRGETLEDAAAREVSEEVGIRIASDRLREVDVIFHDTEFLKDYVHIFEIQLPETPDLQIDGREVVEASFEGDISVLDLTLFPPVRSYFRRRAAGRNSSESSEHPRNGKT